MKPIDLLNFGPTRTVHNNEDGTFTIKTQPPQIVGGSGVSITLTADQLKRYESWQNDGVLIQDALPELSGSQREALMTGLSDEEFRDAAGAETCPACSGTGGLYASWGGRVVDQPCETCGGTGYIEVETGS